MLVVFRSCRTLVRVFSHDGTHDIFTTMDSYSDLEVFVLTYIVKREKRIAGTGIIV